MPMTVRDLALTADGTRKDNTLFTQEGRLRFPASKNWHIHQAHHCTVAIFR